MLLFFAICMSCTLLSATVWYDLNRKSRPLTFLRVLLAIMVGARMIPTPFLCNPIIIIIIIIMGDAPRYGQAFRDEDVYNNLDVDALKPEPEPMFLDEKMRPQGDGQNIPNYANYLNYVAPYYAGRQFRSQQSLASRNSFSVSDPIMKKFGVSVAQDGVAQFLPQPAIHSMEHLFAKAMEQPKQHEFLKLQNAQISPEMKREFYHPSHFMEGIPADEKVRLAHIMFRRHSQESFYNFV